MFSMYSFGFAKLGGRSIGKPQVILLSFQRSRHMSVHLHERPSFSPTNFYANKRQVNIANTFRFLYPSASLAPLDRS